VIAGVPTIALIAGGPAAAHIGAASSLAAIARGLRAAGAPEPDVCPLELEYPPEQVELREILEEVRFDARMRAARGVILCERELSPGTLAASATFEMATRARQAGVPAFAVTGENRLGAFEARILDLQAIEQARGPRGLEAAGARLAQLL
jgi:hypothetical protein